MAWNSVSRQPFSTKRYVYRLPASKDIVGEINSRLTIGAYIDLMGVVILATFLTAYTSI